MIFYSFFKKRNKKRKSFIGVKSYFKEEEDVMSHFLPSSSISDGPRHSDEKREREREEETNFSLRSAAAAAAAADGLSRN